MKGFGTSLLFFCGNTQNFFLVQAVVKGLQLKYVSNIRIDEKEDFGWACFHKFAASSRNTP